MAQPWGSLLGLQGDQWLPSPGFSIPGGGFGHPEVHGTVGHQAAGGRGGAASTCSVGRREEG